jgi:hypothetical protein
MQPINVLYDICRLYIQDLEGVDAAVFRTVDGYRRARDVAALTSCSSHFDTAKHSIEDWRHLRQIEAFFKKNALLSQTEVCHDAAKASFFEAEAACAVTNRRLKNLVGRNALVEHPFQKEVNKMARYISNVLGDFRSFLELLPSLVKVTPGATAHSNRRNSLPQMKMRMKVFATRNASNYVRSLYHMYGFRDPRMSYVHSNRVELVPKNWKTDRTIACEPEGNLPLQLAFDTYAKRRLRRFGINLSDQSANQRAAKHGSIHNDLVTVDFSKASDTISYNTISLLFPVEWFDYLNRVRSPGYRGVFGEGIYNKFSSMGNGSTFCVETLVFAAACYACGSKNFLVYGDDVVIERELFDQYVALTRFLGFTINVEKSFSDGPFRESCGKDYYGGIDVTPTYIRNIDQRKASLCHLVNSMLGVAFAGGKLESFLNELIIKEKLPLVPYNESTLSGVWIHPDRARVLGVLKRRHHIDTFRAYVPKCKRRAFVDSRGYYLWFLRANSQVLFAGPWIDSFNSRDASNQTSSVAVFDHKYVRKRVVWQQPNAGMPAHLYWWTEPR